MNANFVSAVRLKSNLSGQRIPLIAVALFGLTLLVTFSGVIWMSGT